ncbi:enoyl-CoA hydratase/isomerase family protein [Nocardia nova]|uniref:enoyl-CoA hydratase/isomerase family protein n=2 Tax=Nocardia nova TaxID=37330 RepID=UPI0007A54F65|nr:enoyl-CoA hydratase-related protein [Nocardia nova]MBV7707066.1 enoyl-CoA hydratase/isomerase family protein [Nocardia nova]
MMDEVVRYEVDRGVAWLTIDRPHARNSLSKAVRHGLFEGVRRFNDDDSAKVLVLTGAGDKAFCAGGDLKEMSEEKLTIPPVDYVPQFGRNIDVVKPTIAAVNGAAFAGGFLLAQTCDLCIASTTATFAISEVKVGRGSPWAAPLPLMIPRRVAMEIVLTGAPMTARRAYEIGFVNQLAEPDHLRERAQAFAQQIVANAPLSVLAGKQTMTLTAQYPLREAFDRAETIWAPVYSSADAQEGMLSFTEKRAPRWQGK